MFLLRLQAGMRETARQERARLSWERRAIVAIDGFRAGFTYEAQVEQLMGRVQRRLLRPGAPAAMAGNLDRAFRRILPIGHRPSGTRLYGFLLDPTGNLEPLKGKGLAFAGGRAIGEILRGLVHPDRLPPGGRTRLHNRCLGLFGTFVTFDLLAGSGRGRVLPTRFEGRNVFLYWDFIGFPDGGSLPLLAIFPREAARNARPMHRALAIARGDRREFQPVLVPIESASDSLSLRFLPGAASRTERRRFRRFVSGLADREKVIPAGEASDEMPGFRVIRDAVHRNLPYELWLLTRTPPDRGPPPLSPLGFLLAVFVGGAWAAWGFRTLVLGLSGSVPLRGWFLGFFLVAGALPLTILYLSASFLIETRTQRQQEDAVMEAKLALEDLDTGVKTVISRFGEVCRNTLKESAFRDELRRHPRDHLTPALETVFRRFAATGFDLRFALVFRFGRDISVVVAPGQPPNVHRGFLDFFMPIVEGVAIRESPAKEQSILESLTGSEKFLLSAIRYSIKSTIYEDFFHLRDRAQVFTEGRESTLWYYDFLASGSTLEMAVMVLAEAQPPFVGYLREAGSRLASQHPDWRLLFGRLAPGGLEEIDRPGSRRGTFRGQGRLWRSMEGAVRGLEPRFQLEAGSARIALPCRHLHGAVLGAVVPFDRILAEAGRARALLLTAIGAIFLVMMSLAAGIARHLLGPLKRLEEGLGRVAVGDLGTQVGLVRDDELGELTTAFDQMILGLQERRALGRFVSGTLDPSEDQGAAAGAPRAREAALLVSDIRGFTTLSEQHPPEAVVRMLNNHLKGMAVRIQAAGGRVDRFVGDAVIAVFFGKTPKEAAARALRGAIGMRRTHLRIQGERSGRQEFLYEIGVGIDQGPILMGRIGSERRSERAVIGAPLKRAEQLEALSKEGRSTRIIVSHPIVRAAPEWSFRPLDGQEAWELVQLEEGSSSLPGSPGPVPGGSSIEPPPSPSGGEA